MKAIGCNGLLLLVLLSAGTAVQAQDDKPAAAAVQEKLPAAPELFARMVDAVGGADAIKKHKNRTSKGVFEIPAQSVKGAMEHYEAPPSKVYTIIDIPQMIKMESGSDGETFWEIRNGVPRLVTGEEQAIKQREADFFSLLNWDKLYKQTEVAGVEDIDGKPAYKVVLTPEVGPAQTYLVDRKSHLIAQMQMKLPTPMGEMPAVVKFDDYRKVEGVLIPFRITQTMAGMDQVIRFESIAANTDLPANRFDLPEAVRQLKSSSGAATPTPAPPH
jgi:outer membrane lipoprotein-sorting protein